MAHPLIWIDESAQSETATARPIPFVLRTAGETMLALGEIATLDDGPLGSLAERVTQFFESHADGPDILVGALPFDPRQSGYLVQPERVLRVQGKHDIGAIPGLDGSAAAQFSAIRIRSVEPDPDSARFADAVGAALDGLNAPDALLRKVVLSRSVKVKANRDFAAADLMRRLSSDESVTVFATPLPARSLRPRSLIGATPELLLDKRGGHIVSHPLAGSARRHREPEQDMAAASALLKSEKDRREHAMVVEDILDILAPYCVELSTPEGTGLRATASMWHLGTRIVGRLKDASLPSVYFAALLHPTPAVCGLPRELAHDQIAKLEAYDRDFYAGAVGWCDSAGDGRWYVSIRCAELEGDQARLYAGAGIVPGSIPRNEVAETSAKFRAMLDAFGIDAGKFGV
ncbi:isochorismate synthase MenF [Rhizobium sp. SSA_523]|uniref:isochorismate synthase n=1 Tax=Rhizobium sp. SSA_523 TaxID=2952477 RepID=UPI002090F93A|nr:isochorismate synthase [Rhizobium sp. SSA_523]MCO5732808.1 isochorismate synthase [Rhizobium sp. SSA_523]WKC23574.1 isochorismate synthase [Rhizobium sp. SSA_523]